MLEMINKENATLYLNGEEVSSVMADDLTVYKISHLHYCAEYRLHTTLERRSKSKRVMMPAMVMMLSQNKCVSN